MNHPFDLAGDHRLANILFERLDREEGIRQVLADQVILNVAVHAGGEEQVFHPGWPSPARAPAAGAPVT